MSVEKMIEKIDQILPQTQCGLCGYRGCLPYATAIVEKHELIDRCPPGGVKTLRALAELTQQDPSPYLKSIQEKTKLPLQAVIRESECIGCTKCIQACPVDAIVGAAKQMHTVIKAECTGCELCIAPCPVDCIDMVELKETLYQPDKARIRFYARETRLAEIKKLSQEMLLKKKAEEARKAYVLAAVERVRRRRENR